MSLDSELAFLREAKADAQLCGYVAGKVRRMRLARGESQVAFAKRAGIPLRTYKRFESLGLGSMKTFLRALRALGRVDRLFQLFPEAPPKKSTVIERVEMMRRQRFGEQRRRSYPPLHSDELKTHSR